MSLMLMAYGSQGVRASAAPVPEGVSAAIQRFDGGTGTAWFRGPIPFAPGVIEDAADLAAVRILVNGSEPAGGVYLELLEGYHPDGSRRVAFVEFQASVSHANPVPCTVVFGAPRTVPDLPTQQVAVERNTRAWMLAPCVFGITDAHYLCASRITLLPVVPDDDPRIPADLHTWITTEFDSMADATANIGNAQYDEAYPHFCRYVTSGSLAQLARGFRVHASGGVAPELVTAQSWDYYIPTHNFPYPATTFPNTNAIAPLNLNPIGYGKPETPTSNAAPAEWNDMSLSQLYTYWFAGWEYGRLVLLRDAVWMRDSFMAQGTGPATTDLGGVRNVVRRQLLPAICAAQTIKGIGPEVWTSAGNTLFSRTTEWAQANREATMAQRITRWWERRKLYRDTVLETPAWLPKMVGFSTAGAEGQPNFQFEFAPVLLMASLLGLVNDPDIEAEAVQYGAWLKAQTVPTPRISTNTGNSEVWLTPYLVTDPALVATNGGTGENRAAVGAYTCMIAPSYALHYAATGDATSRDYFHHGSRLANMRTFGAPWDGQEAKATSGETLSRKLFGQCHVFSRHAIAWRVNGYLGWEAP